MPNRYAVIQGFLTALAVTIHGRDAGATDSSARRTAAERAIRHGFDQATVPVLERMAGPDPKSIAEKLGSAFCSEPCKPDSAEPATRPGTVRVRAGEWTFDLGSDGNAVFAELDAHEDRARAIALDRSSPISDVDLERLGRSFISKRLAGLVALGKEDTVVPASVARKTEGGTVGRGAPAAQIVANRIVFTRRLQGLAIVGGGGTIAVTFANDGSPLAFSYDWARYSSRATPQATLPVGDLLARLQRIASLRATVVEDRLPALTPPADADPSSAFPFDLTSETTLESFECGYVDFGEPSRDGAVIQPGCSYRALRFVRARSGAVARTGFAGAVPAGVDFERDDRWPEAVVLSGRTLSSPPEGKDAARP